MAMALMKQKSPQAEIQSAGIFAGKNQRVNHTAMEALRLEGIPIDHRSQPVTDKLLRGSDLVLTMTTQHKQSLILQYPHFQDKYFTLKEYVSDADRKVWQELKQAYADYEEKRSIYIQKHEHQQNQAEMEQQLTGFLQDDLQKIQQMEAGLIHYDISDPFGGDLDIYQRTLRELDEHIKLLIKKIDKQKP
jgi:protein-tyrosine phosphatase